MDGCRVAIVGATGAVGSVLLPILEERNFPATEVRLCASERSWGRKLTVLGKERTVEEATPELFGDVDLVFMCAGSRISREIGPLAVENGAVVVDKGSAFRTDPDVPLVIPEINGDDLVEVHKGIVSVPNCSTTPLAMTLKPLMGVNAIERVVVSTYQSVSGTGAAAMQELREQSASALDNGEIAPEEYPHQIAFNVLPQVETFEDNGYTTEEMKMVHETRKILHEPDLRISATCVRVPVMVGHSEAVHIDFEEPIGPGEVREVLSDVPGLTVVDDPAMNRYPMPVDAEGEDDVFVGRIRQDVSNPRGVAMWLVTDNLRKGAALNGIQIAEEMLSRGLLNTLSRRRSDAGRNRTTAHRHDYADDGRRRDQLRPGTEAGGGPDRVGQRWAGHRRHDGGIPVDVG